MPDTVSAPAADRCLFPHCGLPSADHAYRTLGHQFVGPGQLRLREPYDPLKNVRKMTDEDRARAVTTSPTFANSSATTLRREQPKVEKQPPVVAVRVNDPHFCKICGKPKRNHRGSIGHTFNGELRLRDVKDKPPCVHCGKPPLSHRGHNTKKLGHRYEPEMPRAGSGADVDLSRRASTTSTNGNEQAGQRKARQNRPRGRGNNQTKGTPQNADGGVRDRRSEPGGEYPFDQHERGTRRRAATLPAAGEPRQIATAENSESDNARKHDPQRMTDGAAVASRTAPYESEPDFPSLRKPEPPQRPALTTRAMIVEQVERALLSHNTIASHVRIHKIVVATESSIDDDANVTAAKVRAEFSYVFPTRGED